MKLIRLTGDKRDDQLLEVSSLEEFAGQMNAYAQLNDADKATHFRVNQKGECVEEVSGNGRIVALYLQYSEPDPDPRKWRMEPIWKGNPSN